MAAAGFGAVVGPDGVRFTLWAPTAQTARAEVERPTGAPLGIPLARGTGGLFEAHTGDATAGDRYRLRIDDQPAWPDPASRFQPDGVHGPSEIVDPSAFVWSDAAWTGRALDELVVYELHVGTFTEAGTFQGVIDRLPELGRLGVTEIELMPVAAFPGRWNWGYDGGALYAPSATYGRPDDLRRLVDAAHGLGLAVLMDVVYNHLGPDGAYLAAFAPTIFAAHDSPWGGGLDFVDPDSLLGDFFADNAAHWIREYHIDGLRLDATHAIHDEPVASFPGRVARTARAAAPGRTVLVIAEDSRNLDLIVRGPAEGGQALDAVWADDFHHQVRRHVAGDRDGYYADFGGTMPDLVATMRRGWFYCGQQAPFFGGPRGTDPTGIPLERFVICIQNHDQVGNRAMGERLHHQIDPEAYLAASVLLLLAPETPLLFMGQEWAASSPFQFFTDHDEPLGQLVTEGRPS
jgi:maltooligosyltrehalose trehalohydrolase